MRLGMEVNDLLVLEFDGIQQLLEEKVCLKNNMSISEIRTISGVDLAYWTEREKTYAVCCIVTIDYNSHDIVEFKSLSGEITVPYMAGYLSFRELPLIIKTYELLNRKPDIIMFDGNGYLHYRHMGIATHASFILNIPTIGVAKSYLKIENVEYIMPENKVGAYTDIMIHNVVYGRALRTHKDIRPIFISAGNWMELGTATDIVMSLVNNESRQPIPIRLADIETRKMREILHK